MKLLISKFFYYITLKLNYSLFIKNYNINLTILTMYFKNKIF